jgi:hypothetical protein
VAAFKADDAGTAKEPAAVRRVIYRARLPDADKSCALAQAAKGAAADAEAAPERVAVQTATNFKPVVLEAPEKVQRDWLRLPSDSVDAPRRSYTQLRCRTAFPPLTWT